MNSPQQVLELLSRYVKYNLLTMPPLQLCTTRAGTGGLVGLCVAVCLVSRIGELVTASGGFVGVVLPWLVGLIKIIFGSLWCGGIRGPVPQRGCFGK